MSFKGKEQERKVLAGNSFLQESPLFYVGFPVAQSLEAGRKKKKTPPKCNSRSRAFSHKAFFPVGGSRTSLKEGEKKGASEDKVFGGLLPGEAVADQQKEDVLVQKKKDREVAPSSGTSRCAS